MDDASSLTLDKLEVYTLLPFVVYFTTYWILSGFFFVLDRVLLQLSSSSSISDDPSSSLKAPPRAGHQNSSDRVLDRFKIQKGLTAERLRFQWRHLLYVLGLQLLVSLPVGLALRSLWPSCGYKISFPSPSKISSSSSSFFASWRWPSVEPLYPSAQSDLTLFRFGYEFVAIMVIFEFFFFYSHYALHHKSIYKQIHKMHHFYTGNPVPL